MNRCRVLIVDDHEHAREAMCEILGLDEHFEIIGAVASGAEAIVWTEQWMPDLILIDIEMPGMNGLETTRRIKLTHPYVKIVIVTVSDEVSHLFEALKQGAQGYLLKNLAPSTWIEYLLAIVSEEVPLSRELAFQILQEFAVPSPREEHEALTTREREILGCVSSGATNREIAVTLGISEHTVKNHLKNILHKLQLQNRTQLTRYALEQGLAPRSRDFAPEHTTKKKRGTH
ncbi:response regulator [Paenibacillus tepidiphilus]|uniref:response regulator n=1 Tax=Paenibacillus tepidiphilus TaxID=2608683 RepID=UPI001239EAFB|nr:response regulator transcription factor [Paenibacillus tepidiphilus]